MTILSDREIKALCLPPPTMMLDYPGCLTPRPVTHIDGDNWYRPDNGMTYDGRYVREVTSLELAKHRQMISPFEPAQVRLIEDQKIASFGLGSYGYDIRAAPEYKLISREAVRKQTIIDTRNLDPEIFEDHFGPSVIIPPRSFMLTRTPEYIKMPKNVSAIVMTKSTHARIGLICLCTPIEAGWEGEITLEYANVTELPIRFYAGEGAAQLIFLKGNPCDVPYDRSRKYFGQRNITLPTL